MKFEKNNLYINTEDGEILEFISEDWDGIKFKLVGRFGTNTKDREKTNLLDIRPSNTWFLDKLIKLTPLSAALYGINYDRA